MEKVVGLIQRTLNRELIWQELQSTNDAQLHTLLLQVYPPTHSALSTQVLSRSMPLRACCAVPSTDSDLAYALRAMGYSWY
eukprot:2612023-Rhodomonas_salina.1